MGKIEEEYNDVEAKEQAGRSSVIYYSESLWRLIFYFYFVYWVFIQIFHRIYRIEQTCSRTNIKINLINAVKKLYKNPVDEVKIKNKM